MDAGVIGKEIDRAIHEAAMRGESFRVIPLVLAQHGGTDSNVPTPLQTLVWKTVDDVEIVPTILRALPSAVQGLIRYVPPKKIETANDAFQPRCLPPLRSGKHVTGRERWIDEPLRPDPAPRGW